MTKLVDGLPMFIILCPMVGIVENITYPLYHDRTWV
jgi:hypothetical protein